MNAQADARVKFPRRPFELIAENWDMPEISTGHLLTSLSFIKPNGGSMAQLPQARKPCTVNHLALIMGLIGSVEIGEEERKLIDAELDKAREHAKKTFHARNDRAALEAQVHLETL